MRLLSTLFLGLAALTVPSYATSRTTPTTKATYQKVLEGIRGAKTDDQLLENIQKLDKIDIDTLENPFQLLEELSKIPSLRQASRPTSTYFTHKLYAICLKIWHAQVKKEQYITTRQKEEIEQNLKLLYQGQDKAKDSIIIHHVACIIALIKALPQTKLSKTQADTLYQLIGILLKERYTSQEDLYKILQAHIKEEPDTATYLILLELIKVYYLQYVTKQDTTTFSVLIAPLFDQELPTTVQYRKQQILGEILRSLLKQGKKYEAYSYRDQLLPLMPTLLQPLSADEPLKEQDNRLLAEGLLIEWCLLLPYINTLFDDLQQSHNISLDAKIQEKLKRQELQDWYNKLTSQLRVLDLFDPKPEGQLNTLQRILLQKDYLHTLHFLLQASPARSAQDDHAQAKINILLQKLQTAIQILGTQDQKELKESLDKFQKDIQTLVTQDQKKLKESLKELIAQNKNLQKSQEETKKALAALQQKMTQMQQAQQDQRKKQGRTLQKIQKNTATPRIKEQQEKIEKYPFLQSPYIHILVLLLLILLLALFIRRRD